MNKINVGSIQNIKKTLAPEKILETNLKYAKGAGLQSIKWLLSESDLQYLTQKGYTYEKVSDPIYDAVYRIYLTN